MPEKEKKPEFTVTDRRLFSSEGELREDVVQAEERREELEQERRDAQRRANEERSAEREAATPAAVATEPAAHEGEEVPEAPTAAEQKESADAYKESTRGIDEEIRKHLSSQGQEHRAKDFEMNFEKFVASLYMSSLMQLGMAAPQGGKPEVDLMGARQTIDIIGLLQEKTKGNLTSKEESMLQNVLYELRMAYLEVTNMLTRPPQRPGGLGEKR